MKKIAMLAFSPTGYETGQKLKKGLEEQGFQVRLEAKSRHVPGAISQGHVEWTREQFRQADALVFLCACGIAVRSIAPFIRHKSLDPAVVVADECGRFVISLLSGHLGGANALTREVARILDGQAVITTATDLHGRFAVDEFAKRNGCRLSSLEEAKYFAAALLQGEKVGFYSDFPWEGPLPEGLSHCDERGLPAGEGEPLERGMALTVRASCKPFSSTLQVVPPVLWLGMGLKAGKSEQDLFQALHRVLGEQDLLPQALCGIATIDLKKGEPGLLALAEHLGVPLVTFSGEELLAVPGVFTESSFVEAVTGVGNVCERSAVGASKGKLLVEKQCCQGITVALAQREWRAYFD